MFILPASFT